MKNLFLLFILLCVTIVSYSQRPNTVINCYIRDGHIIYGHLAELLPDSIQANLLIDPH